MTPVPGNLKYPGFAFYRSFMTMKEIYPCQRMKMMMKKRKIREETKTRKVRIQIMLLFLDNPNRGGGGGELPYKSDGGACCTF